MTIEEILHFAEKQCSTRALRRMFDPTNNLTMMEVNRALESACGPNRSLQAVANKAKTKLRQPKRRDRHA